MKKVLLTTLIASIPLTAIADNATDAVSKRARVSDMTLQETQRDVRDETVETLNSLLRGEISAVETYRQALTKLSDHPNASTIRKFMEDHQKASHVLTSEVLRLKGTPSTDSGAWGVWAQTVQGTANLFGDAAALKALKEGEEHGLKAYVSALEDPDFSANIKEMIQNTFIKNQQSHIAAIDIFIEQVNSR